MYHPTNSKLMADAHYQELLHDAEMHRLRQVAKPAKRQSRPQPWVSITTMLKLRK